MKKLPLLLLVLSFFIACENDIIQEMQQETSKTELDDFTLKLTSPKVEKNLKKTFVPDDHFEQFIIDLGYDDVLDDYVLSDNIKSVQDLWINDYINIENLTGLEDFESLINLYIGENPLTSLDVTKTINLEKLTIYGREYNSLNISSNINLKQLRLIDCYGLNSLHVTKNINLEEVYIEDGDLTTIDITKNEKLKTIWFVSSNITSLDASNNIGLTILSLDTTGTTFLDVSKNNNLTYLGISNGKLTSLDISDNLKLVTLYANNNLLNSIDVSNNINLTALNVTNNPLTCIEVNQDQLDNIPTNWNKDSEDEYSLNCSSSN